MEHLLLAGDLSHRDRDARIHVTDNEAYLVALDQLACLLNAGADVVRRAFDQQLDRPAQNAAFLVDLLGRKFCSHHFAWGDSGINGGRGIGHPSPDPRTASWFDAEASWE